MTDAPTEREGEGALSKLRRRKVVQWGIAYAVDAPALLTARRMIRNQLGGAGKNLAPPRLWTDPDKRFHSAHPCCSATCARHRLR